jgi:hypothetical protein
MFYKLLLERKNPFTCVVKEDYCFHVRDESINIGEESDHILLDLITWVFSLINIVINHVLWYPADRMPKYLFSCDSA